MKLFDILSQNSKNIEKTDELNVPDILLMVSNDLLVVDNLTSKVHIITHVSPEKESFDDGLAKVKYN